MTIMKRYILVLLALCMIQCGPKSVRSYKDKMPKFVPEEYFVGCLQGSGGFFDRWGSLTRSFYLNVRGEVIDKVIYLHEDLLYDTGDRLERTYVITPTGENSYKLEANGLVGEGEILAYGNALNWKYVLRQPVKGKEWDLTFDDWMYLLEDGTILNRAFVTKFGLRVGEVSLHFRKVDTKRCEESIPQAFDFGALNGSGISHSQAAQVEE